MTHLKIELNTAGTEEVSSATITKLYNIVHNDTLDNTSNLVGRLHTAATYQDYIDYLEGLFDGTNDKGPLYIDANRKYMMFEDPEVLRLVLTHIGDGTGVTLSDLSSVTNIDGWFSNNTTITSLNDLLKFTNVTSISNVAMNDTNVTSVILREGLLNIRNNCFYGCSSLLTIDFPSTLTTINDNRVTHDWGAFRGCTSLTTITGGENITILGSTVFANCSNLLNLGDIDLSSLIHLGAACFAECTNLELGSVTLSNSITTIDDSTFRVCKKLTSINIPGVTRITPGDSFNQGAFVSCDHLTTVTGSNIQFVGQMSFRYCSALSSIDLSNCTYIGVCAFQDCTSLTSVDLSSCTTIKGSAFSGCTNIAPNPSFLSNVTTFESGCFYNCNAFGVGYDLDLNLDGKLFGSNNFYGTGFRSITLHETSKHGISNFSGSGLYDSFGPFMRNLVIFDLSDTKLTVVPGSFGGGGAVPNLTTIILPETISTNLVCRGRDWGTSLLYIVCLSTNPTRSMKPDSYWAFVYMPANLAIYVPDSAYNDYVDVFITNSNDPIPALRLKKISELPSSVTWYTKDHPATS